MSDEPDPYAWQPPAGVDHDDLTDADWLRVQARSNFITEDIVKADRIAASIEASRDLLFKARKWVPPCNPLNGQLLAAFAGHEPPEATEHVLNDAMRFILQLAERIANLYPPGSELSEDMTDDDDNAAGRFTWAVHGESCGGYCEWGCGAFIFTARRDEDMALELLSVAYGTFTINFADGEPAPASAELGHSMGGGKGGGG